MARAVGSESPKSARRIETNHICAASLPMFVVPKAPNPPGGLKPPVRMSASRVLFGSESPKSARRIETAYLPRLFARSPVPKAPNPPGGLKL